MRGGSGALFGLIASRHQHRIDSFAILRGVLTRMPASPTSELAPPGKSNSGRGNGIRFPGCSATISAGCCCVRDATPTKLGVVPAS
jgi:hypothetical protein